MLAPGTEVGSYEVLEPLGHGGMASVYRARHVALGSIHALKVLRSDLVANAGIRQRFLDEGRVQAQFRHPGIVRVTDLVSEPGVAGLVMDLLVGRPLDDVLAGGALSVEQAVAWMLQVLSAVGHAHERGVVHRDLKPSNLFIVEPEGGRRTIRVLDFGVAKLSGKARTLTQETMGTWAYMSPEQLKNASAVDGRSDVFALGAVLFEMVTGQVAFQGQSDLQTMEKVANARSEALDHWGPQLPPTLYRVIQRALALEPEDRFPSCAAMADGLAPLARPEDLALLDDWAGTEQPPPVLLGGAASATWDGGDAFGGGAAPVGETVPAAPVPPPARVPEPRGELVPVAPQVLVPEVLDPTASGRDRAATLRSLTRAPTALDAARERHDVAVRAAGAAQVLAGILNTFVLWMLVCWGLPQVFHGLFALLGLPGVFTWLTWTTGLLGCGLLVLGPIEIASGLSALVRGGDARGTVQRVAVLQLVGGGLGGVPSFLVGGAITAALLAVRPPEQEP